LLSFFLLLGCDERKSLFKDSSRMKRRSSGELTGFRKRSGIRGDVVIKADGTVEKIMERCII